ncbi:MAG: carbohydrate kinase [Gallionella sp.]|nr:carbohydrate kinase [Gallionella sp.]MDD4946792.1 carbohydrate kinase [Gallionella sp.]MDD5612728.1 carbohydrate kinase [Gallionella sp.]
MTPNFFAELTRTPQPLNLGRGAVLLFGEVLADRFPDRTVLGGAPFNVARHLKAFGQQPILITRVGNDELRDEILRVMNEAGMETLGVQCNNSYPTGQVNVHIEDGAHRFEILPMQAYDFIHPGVARMAALSVEPVLVYFGTLAQRHDISRRALKGLLRSTSAVRFLDINLRSPWYDQPGLERSLKQAAIVKLNDAELVELTAMFGLQGGDDLACIRDLMARFDLEQVMVTCGEKGAWHVGREGSRIVVGVAEPVDILVDTVGAGDGFAAVCILGALLGWQIEGTLRRANAFASALCGIRGAIPKDVGFYQKFTEEWGI